MQCALKQVTCKWNGEILKDCLEKMMDSSEPMLNFFINKRKRQSKESLSPPFRFLVEMEGKLKGKALQHIWKKKHIKMTSFFSPTNIKNEIKKKQRKEEQEDFLLEL